MKFAWDPKKAASNRKKHGVSFEEAMKVFDDPDRKVDLDLVHSGPVEIRKIVIGTSDFGNKLTVIYTERKDKTRIISARKATKRNRTEYERAN